MRRQPAAASKVRSAAAPSPVRFSDFNSGPPRELGHQLDLRGPALRLPGDVDIFFLAELLFADSGGRMELGRSGADADVGFAGSGPPRIRRRSSAAGPTGSSTTIAKFCSNYVGALGFARAALRQALL